MKILLFPQFAVGDTAVYTVKLKTTKAWIDNQFSYGIGFPRTGSFSDVKVTITAPTAMGLQVETHEMEFAKQEQGAATVYSLALRRPAIR